MGTPEDTALHGLRVSVGHILDHFGFTQISDDSMDVLSDIMRRFIKKLASSGKIYAEHAGRTQMSSDDLFCAFKKIKYSPVELYHFFAQNHLAGTNKQLARFPVPRAHPRALFHPQPSEKELENRPEHIPRFLQAAHPEWTREGADYLAVMKPSTSNEKKGAAPDFPSFMDFTSKDLGISKEDRRPAPPLLIRTDESSATGIRSSANIASAKLNNYDHPPAPPMFKRKTNKTLNGLKESRSNTPIGRSNSPYNFFDRTESMRTESPSTSREEKPKLKSRLSVKTERVESPMPPMTDEGASSPMPTLELEEYAKDNFDPPLTPGGYDYDDNDNSFTFSDKSSPPPAADSKVAENILLFMRQKKANEEKEQALAKEREKEKENEEKRRKKEEKKREAQKRKEEKKKEQERQKQLQKEKEDLEKKKRKEEAKLEKERREKEQREKKEKEEAERREKAEAERRRAAEVATPPMRMSEHDVKPLKLVISNPMSSNASSAFSPPTAKAASQLDAARFATSTGEDDSDTIPFVEGTAVVHNGATEFPLNISISSTDSPKKKHKKKDKERDRSSSPHKKHKKKDKEHKKKKKKEREREEEEEHKEKKKKKHHEEPVPEQKITLKIRLGEQSTSSAESGAQSSIYSHEPVKLKFKNILPDRAEEKVPPLRLGMSSTIKEEKKHTPEKTKLVTKAELKAPASSYSSKTLSEKEEKQKRREERKRREREEAEQRQREELERLRREHEEKLKKEAEEKRREEEQREAEEKRRRKEKEQREREQREREQREREQKEREEKERRDREKEAARKEKEREKERQSKSSGHHSSSDSHHKKKHKKEKREREEREEREREKERERIAREEKEQKKRQLEATRALELALSSQQGPSTSAGGGGGDDDDSCDDNQIWICPECSVAWAEGANMVGCDGCNNWFHWTCVGLIYAPPDDSQWFCRKCTKKNNKRPGAPPGGGGSGGGPAKKRRKGEGHEYLK